MERAQPKDLTRNPPRTGNLATGVADASDGLNDQLAGNRHVKCVGAKQNTRPSRCFAAKSSQAGVTGAEVGH